MYHIACNIDSKYTRFCGVLMVSVFENNKDESIKVHILGDGLTQKDKKDLQDIASSYGNRVVFYDVNDDMFQQFPVSDQWPRVIYYRLMLPSLVESDVDRVLYVDCDIIFRGPIKELMEVDLKNNTVAAVEDVFSHFLSYVYPLGYKPTDLYFNSGVILIDVKRWKNRNITNRCLEFIQNNKVTHPDQDALNAVLHDSWLRVSNRWNFLSNYHVTYLNMTMCKMDMDKSYPYYPIICHFTGQKPWDSRCRSPFKSEFFEYQKKTIWHNCIPKHSMGERIHQVLAILLEKIKIKTRNPYYKYDI